MARRERIFVTGGIYHIYSRVSRGEPVFDNPLEAERWVDIAGQVVVNHELSVLAWCLMSNHYHLVVQTGCIPLWRAMAVLQRRVSRDFNRRHEILGRLWQSRYKARIIQDNADLEHLLAYVHLNPVAAGIVIDPSDYRQSGHCELLGLAPARLCSVGAALLDVWRGN